jgi:hypothetical protein
MAPSPARRSASRSVRRARGRPRNDSRTPRVGANRRVYTTPRYTPRGARPRPRTGGASSGRRRQTARDAAESVVSYKPREERSYEEFHPDLDIDAPLQTIIVEDEAEESDFEEEKTDLPLTVEPARQGTPTPTKSIPTTDQKLSDEEEKDNVDDSAAVTVETAGGNTVLDGEIHGEGKNIVVISDDEVDMAISRFRTPDRAGNEEGDIGTPTTPYEDEESEPDQTPTRRSRKVRKGGRALFGRRPRTVTIVEPEHEAPSVEVLDLPKPTYRKVPVTAFENGMFTTSRPSLHHALLGTKETSSSLLQPEVKKQMLRAGYQTTDMWQRSQPLIRDLGNYYEEDDVGAGVGVVKSIRAEYDMDLQGGQERLLVGMR